jgi:hypothetical protein
LRGVGPDGEGVGGEKEASAVDVSGEIDVRCREAEHGLGLALTALERTLAADTLFDALEDGTGNAPGSSPQDGRLEAAGFAVEVGELERYAGPMDGLGVPCQNLEARCIGSGGRVTYRQFGNLLQRTEPEALARADSRVRGLSADEVEAALRAATTRSAADATGRMDGPSSRDGWRNLEFGASGSGSDVGERRPGEDELRRFLDATDTPVAGLAAEAAVEREEAWAGSLVPAPARAAATEARRFAASLGADRRARDAARDRRLFGDPRSAAARARAEAVARRAAPVEHEFSYGDGTGRPGGADGGDMIDRGARWNGGGGAEGGGDWGGVATVVGYDAARASERCRSAERASRMDAVRDYNEGRAGIGHGQERAPVDETVPVSPSRRRQIERYESTHDGAADRIQALRDGARVAPSRSDVAEMDGEVAAML